MATGPAALANRLLRNRNVTVRTLLDTRCQLGRLSLPVIVRQALKTDRTTPRSRQALPALTYSSCRVTRMADFHPTVDHDAAHPLLAALP